MSDWEDLCGDMGWANDEQAFDKLIDFVEKKAAKPHPKYYGQEFTPEQKRAYAIKKNEERRLLSTPIGQYIVSRWGANNVSNVQEKTWNENGVVCKSIYFELYAFREQPSFSLTITKYNDLSYCVKFCNHTGRRGARCTEVSGNRLTPRLVEKSVSKNDAELRARQRTR